MGCGNENGTVSGYDSARWLQRSYSRHEAMTDLKDKTVEQLRHIVIFGIEGSAFYRTDAFDELARRIEELNKLCKYHEEVEKELQQRNEAHDAETAAKALEEVAKPLAMLGLQSDRYQDDPEFRDAVDDVLQAVSCAAEYRAKAGRKE